MFSYLIRRLLYSVPILFGVMLISFLLSNVIQSPESRARVQLGKRATAETIAAWLHLRGADKPLFYNTASDQHLLDSQFFNHIKKLATFELGVSDVTGRDLKQVFLEGAVPSLLITLPAFLVGIAMAISIALYLVFVRQIGRAHV